MDEQFLDLICEECGAEFNTAREGVTSSAGRELCCDCSWSPECLQDGEFIPG